MPYRQGLLDALALCLVNVHIVSLLHFKSYQTITPSWRKHIFCCGKGTDVVVQLVLSFLRLVERRVAEVWDGYPAACVHCKQENQNPSAWAQRQGEQPPLIDRHRGQLHLASVHTKTHACKYQDLHMRTDRTGKAGTHGKTMHTTTIYWQYCLG